MKVAVVGGSIAGCSAAILFRRAGHDVQVFESAKGALVGRGGGMGTPERVIRSMIQFDVLDGDFARCVGEEMPFVVRTDEHPRSGYRPWAVPTTLATFHWSALWRQLRKRVPDTIYRSGCEVLDTASRPDGRVAVRLADGAEPLFDLVILADGRDSPGRRRLFPDAELEYRGYVLWRGLLPESALDGAEALGGTCARVFYTEGAGHMVVYLLPSVKGSTAPGERLIDWAAYVPLPEDQVGDFMTDRHGDVRERTLPPGTMRADEEQRLEAQLRSVLPDVYGELVERTKSPHAHLIHTAEMPAYRSGRQVLIGDAGTVTPPFTGSGVFKGFQNAASLLEAIDGLGSIEQGLDSWSAKQLNLGRRLSTLGQKMERALVWDTDLDLATADAASTEAWWQSAVSFPEGVSFDGQPTAPPPGG